jgi:hypothetical protein
MDAQFDVKRFPAGAVDFLLRRGVEDPVFTPDRWGGYLIYRVSPRVLAVVDDRHDLYGAEFFRNYLKVIHAQPGWEQALAEIDPAWILLPAKSALADALAQSPSWKPVYRDETSVLYSREERAKLFSSGTSKRGHSEKQISQPVASDLPTTSSHTRRVTAC